MKTYITISLLLPIMASCSKAPELKGDDVSGKVSGTATPAPTATVKPTVSKETTPIFNWWSQSRADNILVATDFTKGLVSDSGYIQDLQEGCVFKNQVEGTVPLILYFNPVLGDNTLGANPNSLLNLNNPAFGYSKGIGADGSSPIIEGYVWPADSGKAGRKLNLYYHAGRGDNYLAASAIGISRAGVGHVGGYAFQYVEAILPDCASGDPGSPTPTPIPIVTPIATATAVPVVKNYSYLGRCDVIFRQYFNDRYCHNSTLSWDGYPALATVCPISPEGKACAIPGSKCVVKDAGKVFQCN